MQNKMILFEQQNVKLEVNIQNETVWLTTAQMSQLFETQEEIWKYT